MVGDPPEGQPDEAGANGGGGAADGGEDDGAAQAADGTGAFHRCPSHGYALALCPGALPIEAPAAQEGDRFRTGMERHGYVPVQGWFRVCTGRMWTALARGGRGEGATVSPGGRAERGVGGAG
jgi:hypothetical protein